MGMGSRQRVLDALNHKTPDKVPYVHHNIHMGIRQQIVGHPLKYDYPEPAVNYAPIARLGTQAILEPAINNGPEVAERLGMDSIGMHYMPPFWVHAQPGEGGIIVRDGLLSGPEVLDQIHFPNPDDYMKPLENFCKRYQGEYALYVTTRLGISFILNCVGLENFSINIYEEPDFIKELMSRYTDWVIRLIDNCQECGVDYMFFCDDFAYKSGSMFSPATWDEFFKPYLQTSISHLRVPWIWHSDGNILPLLDRVLELGANGINPMEPGTMDMAALKRDYGNKVCLTGNIDMNHTLTRASREEVFQAVQEAIELFGPGGNYMISDSNCIADFCSAQNVLWMAEAVREFRNIYD